MAELQLTVTAAVDQAIRRHGVDTYPHECCGALVGRAGCVSDVVALPNTTEEGPRRRFLVRPTDYREAERRAGELGGELLGFYHSHPDHPARPSQYDLDHAWPTFAYVIVSVVGEGAARGSSDLSRRSADLSRQSADLSRQSADLSRQSADLSRQSAEGATAEGATAEGATAEGATAGDMTVWYLKDDRSSFEEGSLQHGKNTHPDAAQTVHG
jgi:proteasome lid subunit RPN8/RPN11